MDRLAKRSEPPPLVGNVIVAFDPNEDKLKEQTFQNVSVHPCSFSCGPSCGHLPRRCPVSYTYDTARIQEIRPATSLRTAFITAQARVFFFLPPFSFFKGTHGTVARYALDQISYCVAFYEEIRQGAGRAAT